MHDIYQKLVEYKTEYGHVILQETKDLHQYIFRYLTVSEYAGLSRILDAQKSAEEADENSKGLNIFYEYVFDMTFLFTNSEDNPETHATLGRVVFEKSTLDPKKIQGEEKSVRESFTFPDIIYSTIIAVFPSYRLEHLYKMVKPDLYKLLLLALDLHGLSLIKFMRKLYGSSRNYKPRYRHNPPSGPGMATDTQQQALQLAEQAALDAYQEKDATTKINWEEENSQLKRFLGGS